MEVYAKVIAACLVTGALGTKVDETSGPKPAR
jgi:hypothetical protein